MYPGFENIAREAQSHPPFVMDVGRLTATFVLRMRQFKPRGKWNLLRISSFEEVASSLVIERKREKPLNAWVYFNVLIFIISITFCGILTWGGKIFFLIFLFLNCF